MARTLGATHAEVLVRFFEEERAMARHQEEQRSTVTNFVATLSAGIVGFLGLVYGIENIDWRPLFRGGGFFLTLLGSAGALMSAKYYERSIFHFDQADRFREKLDQGLSKLGLQPFDPQRYERHVRRFSIAYRGIRNWVIFVWIHLFIVFAGVVVVGYSFLR